MLCSRTVPPLAVGPHVEPHELRLVLHAQCVCGLGIFFAFVSDEENLSEV